MSFRELRSFAETMRLLGYPHVISMESFRQPNVELVADCLYWLIKRYEPSSDVVYDIERESDRVFFFKQICEAALAKGRVRLNIKKLYQSDGHAVQEMLKLASVLKQAWKATTEADTDFTGLQQMAAQKNMSDAKAVQQLCSDLTADGSTLFFLVEEEMGVREERQRVLSRATEVGEFERRLRELLVRVTEQVEQLQQSVTNLAADETNLEQKIENKRTQLERTQKRLKSLMAVRPAYLEEYERHESELQAQFVKYLEQYRNLEYLEHQLARFNAREDAMLEAQERRLRVMRERLRKEELRTLRGNAGGPAARSGGAPIVPRRRPARDESSDDDDDEEFDDEDNTSDPPVRDAAEEGSSVDDSDEESELSETPPRPQNAMGRARPSVELGSRAGGDADSERDAVYVQRTHPGRPMAAGRNPVMLSSEVDDDTSSEEEETETSLSGSSELSTADTDDSDSQSDSEDI